MEIENSTSTIMLGLVTTVIPDAFKNVTFTWYDYLFFVLMLIASIAIGIYFGCFGTKQSTTSEYLMGGKKMRVWPIAISLVASHISGITLLAVPADIYKFGAMYWWGSVSLLIVCIVTIYVFLPMFYNLKITSVYEYLERRFDCRTREFASFLFGLSLFLYLPIVIYIPALAFSAATGMNLHIVAPIVCGICIFYTTIGGLKAVVWTDTLQFTVTVGALITVFILGLISAGGITAVFQKSYEGGRLNLLDFDPDPTKRDTFWIICIGLTVHWIAQNTINQSCVQKFLSVPTYSDAKWAVIYYTLGTCIIKTFCVITGLIMYAKYSDCDPFTTKVISRNDQLLPYYVMDVAGNIPGLPGLFIAGVFSSALSTLSANLNCLAGTIYEDFVIKFMGQKHSDTASSNILKLIVIITGIISTALVLVFEKLGGILPLTISIGGIVHGPLLGLFCLGALIPPANSKGAIFGGVTSMLSVGTLWVLTKYYEKKGYGFAPKPISVDGCPSSFNITSLNATLHAPNPTDSEPEQFFLLRLSFYYYTLLGAFLTIVIGIIVSYIFKNKDEDRVDKELLSPVIHCLLSDEYKRDDLSYLTINKALHIVTTNSQTLVESNNVKK